MNRNERRRQMNIMLSALPPFTPANEYDLCHVNRRTSSLLLQDLIEMARKTTQYSIDTENDYHSHRPALIQIEYVRQRSVILLVEVNHLPHQSSALFWLIQSLFKVILRPSNRILSWGEGASELSAFVPCGLFSTTMVDQTYVIDVQDCFKEGYNKRYPHTCGLPVDDDHPSCTCPHRPVKNNNNPWSLQKAVAWTFCQFLDTSYTKSNWSRPLDRGDAQSSSMIEYAANDCLAVTKIFAVLENKWTVKH